jgi:hypothetical protein
LRRWELVGGAKHAGIYVAASAMFPASEGGRGFRRLRAALARIRAARRVLERPGLVLVRHTTSDSFVVPFCFEEGRELGFDRFV